MSSSNRLLSVLYPPTENTTAGTACRFVHSGAAAPEATDFTVMCGIEESSLRAYGRSRFSTLSSNPPPPPPDGFTRYTVLCFGLTRTSPDSSHTVGRAYGNRSSTLFSSHVILPPCWPPLPSSDGLLVGSASAFPPPSFLVGKPGSSDPAAMSFLMTAASGKPGSGTWSTTSGRRRRG
uniref:Uncharacterized protein n=1 Tax=Zea mays TaxID=4577 RepID=B4FRA7_MAIZE|nr:unknown [Zea mays]